MAKAKAKAGTKTKATEDKRNRIVRCIGALPPGMVSSYGAIAKGAGWPGAARRGR
jgi:alkylated DNA nucleotide flippase Atl1